MRNKHILLIDDDIDERIIFQDIIDSLTTDCLFSYAESADDAKEQLKWVIPDVIFLDHNMPRKNGLAFLSEIRKSELYSNVPVIFYSTGLTPELSQQAMDAGATICIKKYSNLQEFQKLMQRIINESYLLKGNSNSLQ